jgi:hypothetical protein
MITYENGFIYKIEHIDNPTIKYIGSTHDFRKRCESHYNTNILTNRRKLYRTITECGGWEQFKIQIIDLYHNINRSQLLKIEGIYQKQFKSPLNMRVAGRSNQEYVNDNIEYLRKHRNREIVCECGVVSRYKNLSRHRRSKNHSTRMTELLTDGL